MYKSVSYKVIVTGLLLLSAVVTTQAQSALKIGSNSMTIDKSAVFELESTNKGFLPPRLTTVERNLILPTVQESTIPTGLTIYNTTTNCINFYTGTYWYETCGRAINTSGGTAVVTSYTCTTAEAGKLIKAKDITVSSRVTQTITAQVAERGTYDIIAVANGVTFAGAGFIEAGTKDITLTATGTPKEKGTFTYALSTTTSCTFDRYTSITGVYAKVDGSFKDFATHNLGADIALDPFSFVVGDPDGSAGTRGWLYQWGRSSDGHQLRNSATITGPQVDQVANKFIFNSTGGDWLSSQNDNLWVNADGSKATNDPCPSGFRVPTIAQWESAITQNVLIRVPAGSYYKVGPALILSYGGFRLSIDGYVIDSNFSGYYWSSSINGVYVKILSVDYITNATIQDKVSRGNGSMIRCIAE